MQRLISDIMDCLQAPYIDSQTADRACSLLTNHLQDCQQMVQRYEELNHLMNILRQAGDAKDALFFRLANDMTLLLQTIEDAGASEILSEYYRRKDERDAC